jgi:NAD(P)-dependent dehydrogenase (short-subunit alcohol dehydrogenase family)
MRIDATTRALVTGASRGIGRAVAAAVAARGGAVGLLARSERELDALARELGPRAVALPADVGDREQVRAAVERFVEAAGGLDLVAAIVRGVERDRRAVHHPPFVRLLGLNGLAPRTTDAILRRLRGRTAAPRRD